MHAFRDNKRNIFYTIYSTNWIAVVMTYYNPKNRWCLELIKSNYANYEEALTYFQNDPDLIEMHHKGTNVTRL